MEKVTHGKMNSRERGSLLSLEGNQTIRWEMDKEKKRKKGNRMKKKKGEEENRVWRRTKKKKRALILGVPTFRKSLVRELKLVYSMKATSRCQKKRKEVGVSPTLVISCLVAM